MTSESRTRVIWDHNPVHNRSAMVTALMIGFEPTYHSLTVSRFANQPHENILPTSKRACRIDITNAIDEQTHTAFSYRLPARYDSIITHSRIIVNPISKVSCYSLNFLFERGIQPYVHVFHCVIFIISRCLLFVNIRENILLRDHKALRSSCRI